MQLNLVKSSLLLNLFILFFANQSIAEKKEAATSCESAIKIAESGKTSDAYLALKLCKEARDKICDKHRNGTGDGRYLLAFCQATAEHAAYMKLKEK